MTLNHNKPNQKLAIISPKYHDSIHQSTNPPWCYPPIQISMYIHYPPATMPKIMCVSDPPTNQLLAPTLNFLWFKVFLFLPSNVVNPSIHPIIRPFIHLYINQSRIYPSIQPWHYLSIYIKSSYLSIKPIHLFNHLFIDKHDKSTILFTIPPPRSVIPSTDLPNHPPYYTSIQSSIYMNPIFNSPFNHSSIYIYPQIHSFIIYFIDLGIYLIIHLTIHPLFIHPSIHHSIQPFIYP